MERALIIGNSGGIGGALEMALAQRGVAVTGLSRTGQGLDVTDEASVQAHLGALGPGFDWIFVASGILGTPEKALNSVQSEELARVFAVNAIGPALVLKHAARLLPKDRVSRVGVLTARVGSIGDNHMGGWYSYRAAKAAANQLTHTAAVELGRKYKQAVIVALHPGTVATPFTENYPGHKKVPPAEAAENLLRVLGALTPAESGKFFDWAGKEVPW